MVIFLLGHVLFVNQKGFSYLAMLFFIATIAISMAVVTERDSVKLQREKERDWLFIGQQYQQAIASYYKLSPDGINVFPNSIAALLHDDRHIQPIRHLRKVYLDPLTLQPWAELHNEEGQLIGVYSHSQGAILLAGVVNKMQGHDFKRIRHADLKFKPTQEMLIADSGLSIQGDQNESNTTFDNADIELLQSN